VYICLLLTFTTARAVFPDDFTGPGQSDRIMPEVIVRTVPSWLAGILLAAPYAAIMSTVAAFLLMVSSGIVRDLYQRNINPDLSEHTAKTLSYVVTAGVGVVAAACAFYRPDYLQVIILFTGAGLAATFLAPVTLGLYWPRMTRAGAISAAVGGCAAVVVLYVLGRLGLRSHVQLAAAGFQPYYLLGFDPSLWGLSASFLLGVGVSLCTRPPPAELIELVFGRPQSAAATAKPAAGDAGKTAAAPE
jgi:SSS family solute:Na+ symporter/sodium/pantothenate symporter